MKAALRLVAAFDGPSALGPFVRRLESLGIAATQIEIRSSAPIEHELLPESQRHHRSRVLWAAIVGGLLGGGIALSFAVLTAKAYPMVTGGMKIVAGPPTGIVTFEGTALGLVLCTVAAVVLEAGLIGKVAPSPLERELSSGCILVSVTDIEGELLHRALLLAQSTAVRTWHAEEGAAEATGQPSSG